MFRRLMMVTALIVLSTVLVGCPDQDATLEEGVEEIQDETDDAL